MTLPRLIRHLCATRWRTRRAFPAAALERIEAAITRSEQRHGGQIRFAVEHALEPADLWRGKPARVRALEVFSLLGVWDTEQNNGVLVYLLLADRDVEIVADRGVHGRVGAQAWESICHEMEAEFRLGHFEEGIAAGIARISQCLEAHYPAVDRRENELSDRAVVL